MHTESESELTEHYPDLPTNFKVTIEAGDLRTFFNSSFYKPSRAQIREPLVSLFRTTLEMFFDDLQNLAAKKRKEI